MFCRTCGKENLNGVPVCAYCGAQMDQPERPVVPPQRVSVPMSGMAVASLILALLGIITCITAPIGLILGIVALNQIGKSRGQLGGGGLAIAGIIVSSVMVLLAFVVLPAILFPVFARAREAARKSSCQSNMKELGTALSLYYGDYDATLPSSVLYGGSKNWNSRNFVYFAKNQGVLPPPPGVGVNGTPQSWPMVFYKYMLNKDIIWCPSDPVRRNDPSAAVSYYYKAAVDCAWYGGPASKGPVCKKEGDFNFPADQIVFYEHNGWHWGDASKGLANGVTINCLFLDGHIAYKRISSSGYTVSENPEPLPRSGYGEPAWFNYDYANSSAPTVPAALWNPRQYGDNLP